MWFARLVSVCRNLIFGGRVERDLDQELRSYRESLADELEERGMPSVAARQAAQRALGGLDQVKERVRDARAGARLETLWRDAAYASRVLARTPGFAAAAILSLGLGIGANTAIFQLLNAVAFRGLPVAQADELAQVRIIGEGRWGRQTGRNRQVSLPIWQQLRDHQQAFSGLAAFADTRFNLAPRGEIRYVEGLWVSGSFFSVLDVRPVIGRLFTPDDDRSGCGYPGAVISHGLWQREFQGHADVIGRELTLGTDRVPIVGVTPEEFFGVEVGRRFDVALPLCSSGFNLPSHFWLAILGRLRPGVTLAQANDHVRGLGPAILAETVPPTYRPDEAARFRALKFEVSSAASGVSPLRVRFVQPLWLLMAIAGAVLLLAATNLANLMLARAAAREHEFALRLAIGGSRIRIVQQVLIEGVLLMVAGALLGVWLARFAAGALVRAIGTPIDPIFLDLRLDWRVVSLATLISAASVSCFGLAPALRAASSRVTLPLQARGLAAGRRFRGGTLLVIVQVALSFVLVFGAGLFARSFQKITGVDAGFRSAQTVLAHMFFTEADPPKQARAEIYRALDDGLRALPGVLSAAATSNPPLGGFFSDTSIKVDGRTVGITNVNQVGHGYFQTMDMSLMAGRDFDDRDTPSAPRVAVASETFARRFLDGEPRDAVGRIVAMPAAAGRPDATFLVVGIVEDSKFSTIREEFGPILFIADAQDPQPGTTRRFVLHTRARETEVMAAITRHLDRLHPTASVRFEVMEQLIGQSLLRERLVAALSMSFGALALALAAVGLYGVMLVLGVRPAKRDRRACRARRHPRFVGADGPANGHHAAGSGRRNRGCCGPHPRTLRGKPAVWPRPPRSADAARDDGPPHGYRNPRSVHPCVPGDIGFSGSRAVRGIDPQPRTRTAGVTVEVSSLRC